MASCVQIYSLEARCTAAEERADESEKTSFDMQQEMAQLHDALDGVRAELSQTTAALSASRQEGAKSREDAAAAAATAAERLAAAEAATAAAKAEAAAAQARSGEAAAKAVESIQRAKDLQEKLDRADRDLGAVRELAHVVHKQLMETECVAAFAVEEAAEGESGEGSPVHQILDLAHRHIEVGFCPVCTTLCVSCCMNSTNEPGACRRHPTARCGRPWKAIDANTLLA